jgi:hypothetical protein
LFPFKCHAGESQYPLRGCIAPLFRAAAGFSLSENPLQNPHRFDGDFTTTPLSRKKSIVMSFCLKQHSTSRRLQPDCALQFYSRNNLTCYLSSLVGKLPSVYSGNNPKTHSDLNKSDRDSLQSKNARQKKNKPISGVPTQSSQYLLRQKIIGKISRYEKR